MSLFLFTIFVLTFIISVVSTYCVRLFALKFNITDKPNIFRKIHHKNTALLGGLAIFITFCVVCFFLQDKLLMGKLEPHHWLGVFIGGGFLIIGGILDDIYNLSPRKQIIWPILAIISVIIGGVEIEKITNPFGGYIYLGGWSAVLIFIWLLGMTYTTKLLDGIDGLVSGTVSIGAFIIFLFTMTTQYYQPDIGIVALVLSAACLGFLVFNWHPASIFLGEGGSTFLGFILGVLAIISGGKIAVALLIMAIPILDVAWTIARRLMAGKNPFKFSDRLHLHFRLLDTGIGQRKTVLIYYIFASLFGLSALFVQSLGKFFTLIILILIMTAIVIGFNLFDKKNKFSK